MKAILLVALVLGSVNTMYAQAAKNNTKLASLFKADLGMEGIGLTYEPRIAGKLVIDLSAGAGGAYNVGEERLFEYHWEFTHPAFYFALTPKYFYNRKKRFEKGKTMLFNSGNFIGLRLKYATPGSGLLRLVTRNTVLVNAHWGIQRALGKHFLFNTHLGAGYALDVDQNFGTIYPAMDFKFAYVIAQSSRRTR